jgi:predicted Fe-Mo cluster-binding NifX family protein
MTTRVVIPTEDNDGLEAHVAQHFGRAPYFTIIDLEKGKITKIEAQPNTGEHAGGTGHPHENLLALKPNVIIAQGMGPGGLQSFSKNKVTVLKTNSEHVKDVVEAFQKGKLTELTAGCEHAHHDHEHTH